MCVWLGSAAGRWRPLSGPTNIGEAVTNRLRNSACPTYPIFFELSLILIVNLLKAIPLHQTSPRKKHKICIFDPTDDKKGGYSQSCRKNIRLETGFFYPSFQLHKRWPGNCFRCLMIGIGWTNDFGWCAWNRSVGETVHLFEVADNFRKRSTDWNRPDNRVLLFESWQLLRERATLDLASTLQQNHATRTYLRYCLYNSFGTLPLCPKTIVIVVEYYQFNGEWLW